MPWVRNGSACGPQDYDHEWQNMQNDANVFPQVRRRSAPSPPVEGGVSEPPGTLS